MSLLALFDIGRSALLTSQTALDVTSHNISNANTPHFSRQEAVLEIASPVKTRAGFIGRGVTISNVRRHFDIFLEAQILGQRHNTGRASALESGLSSAEDILNEQVGLGLSGRLSEYFNAWEDVANNPQSEAQRTILLQQAANLVSTSKSVEEGLNSIIDSAGKEIGVIVERINAIAENISELNEKIAQIEGGSISKANDLRDTRNGLLSELSEFVDFKTLEDSSGRLTVMVGQRNLVSGSIVHAMEAKTTAYGNIAIEVDSIDITGRITSGELSGLLDLRDTLNDEVLHELRRFTASLVKETNIIHQGGYGLDPAYTGLDFFSPLEITTRDYSPGARVSSATVTDLSALTLNEYDIHFTSATDYEIYDRDTDTVLSTGTYTSGSPIAFNGMEITIEDDGGTPQSGDSFFISPFESSIRNFGIAISEPEEVAASATDTGLPGDNENALALIEQYEGALSDLGNTTLNDYYGTIVTTTGILSRAAQDSSTFEQTLLKEMQFKRDSISAVNLDEEAINLIRFQKAYEAGARIIRVTDELLETLLQL